MKKPKKKGKKIKVGEICPYYAFYENKNLKNRERMSFWENPPQ